MNLFAQTEHRLNPLPKGPWIGRQDWQSVTFAHWPLEPEVLSAQIPRQFVLDTYDGQAWLSIVGLQVSNNRLRGLPPIPGLSSLAQINVRTYITLSGNPGIYTFSMDASNPFINRIAYYIGHLNYLDADVSISRQKQFITVKSERTDRKAQAAEYDARFESVSTACRAGKGSLVYWLAERYCLYAVTARDKVLRYDIHHPPWQLQEAKLEVNKNTLSEAFGVVLPNREPLAFTAEKQKVVLWPPCNVE